MEIKVKNEINNASIDVDRDGDYITIDLHWEGDVHMSEDQCRELIEVLQNKLQDKSKSV